MKLNHKELHLIREWFNAVQDLNTSGYLDARDYNLVAKIYLELGMRVPNSIKNNVSMTFVELPPLRADGEPSDQ